ncbi:MAG TPA: CPBP family intramembrane glutamic endopeptidase [Phnomibacter sp.]|nr:CPBP family intramembrane glutamic endopeptidase [Phnomibacter sp.]
MIETKKPKTSPAGNDLPPANKWMELTLFLAGIFCFAWFVGSGGAIKWLALAGLVLSAYALYRKVLLSGNAKEVWRKAPINNELLYGMTGIGMVIGLGVGIVYRVSIGMNALPASFFWFTLTAAAIGATEEFIFRGVLFYMLRKRNIFLTVMVSSLAHAAYKALLFISPFAQQTVPVVELFCYTFLAGLVLGTLRILAASTAAPLAAHVAWDTVVYGDSPAAPWWVW